jgi:alanine dehydrogenase
MRVGVPAEIKDHEDRVGLVPATVQDLVARGHSVMIEKGAGRGAGIADRDYVKAGARIIADAAAIWAEAEMVVKVKEPLVAERARLSRGQILFTYLHLAPDPEQAADLMASGATCIAYETVTSSSGALPLLTPMSEVAGRMAVHVGAHCLENAARGRGLLLGGVPGVAPARVLVLGGGVAGTHAAAVAIGMGAEVVVVDRSLEALRRIDARFDGRATTTFSTAHAVAELVAEADLVIGTVLIPGANAPKLLSRAMLKTMKRGAVIVDVAIDQGGCTETSRPTTHSRPTYVVDGVVHYCVANMPGGVARTSTFALNNATMPFVLALADKGWRQACRDDPHLAAGVNVHAGRIVHPAVAAALGQELLALEKAVA